MLIQISSNLFCSICSVFLHPHFYLLAFLHDPQHTLLSIIPPQHTAGSRHPGTNFSTVTLQLPHLITAACACTTLSCLGEPLHSPKSPRDSGTWLRERGKGKLKQYFVVLWHMYAALIKLYWMDECFFSAMRMGLYQYTLILNRKLMWFVASYRDTNHNALY